MGGQGYMHMPPQSPAPFQNNRQSTYSAYTNLTHHHNDTNQNQNQNQRLMSMGGMSNRDYWQDGPGNRGAMSTGMPSTDNLLAMNTPPPRAPSRSPLGGFAASRPVSQMDFMRSGGGPDDELIVEAIRAVLREVDLETVTKKQGMSSIHPTMSRKQALMCCGLVRSLVEQKLQTECQGERRTFLDRQIDTELANMPM
jgi:chitin synthase